MLEMLNPSAGDVVRFAAKALKVNLELRRAMKSDPAKGRALVAEKFCTPPATARRRPDLARLRDDTQRYFGWNQKQWAVHEGRLQRLLAQARTYTVVDRGLNVHCYSWRPTATPRGRMLMCHGWEGYGYNFALLIAEALDAGYEIHTFDHLAHGASEGSLSGLPNVLGTLLAVEHHVRTRSGPVDVLVGHSLGGAAAVWAAAHGRIKPRRLVLLAPFYDTRKLAALWAKAHFLPDDLRLALQSELERSSGMSYADFMPPALATGLSRQGRPRVLVLHDPDDRMTAFQHSRALAELGSGNVRLHSLDRLGHVAMLADPGCVRTVMEFVGE